MSGNKRKAERRRRACGFLGFTFTLKVLHVKSTSRCSRWFIPATNVYNIETAWPPRCTTLRGTHIIRERGDKWVAVRHNGTKEGHNKPPGGDGERARAFINDAVDVGSSVNYLLYTSDARCAYLPAWLRRS